MLDEARILDTLGVEMDVDLYTQTPAAAAAEIGRLGVWSELGGPATSPASSGGSPGRSAGRSTPSPTRRGPARRAAPGPARAGQLADEPGRRPRDGRRAAPGRHRQARRRAAVRRRGAPRCGLVDGELVAVRGPASTITLPLAVSRDGRRRRLGARARRRHRHRRPAGCRRRRRVQVEPAGTLRTGGRATDERSVVSACRQERCSPTCRSDADGSRASRCWPTTRGGSGWSRRLMIFVLLLLLTLFAIWFERKRRRPHAAPARPELERPVRACCSPWPTR